jgi:hypothetical protein
MQLIEQQEQIPNKAIADAHKKGQEHETQHIDVREEDFEPLPYASWVGRIPLLSIPVLLGWRFNSTPICAVGLLVCICVGLNF